MAVSPTYSGGVAGANYEPTTITELGGMIGKIAYSVIRENTANDPLAVFDKMPVNKGDTIEQATHQGRDRKEQRHPGKARKGFKSATISAQSQDQRDDRFPAERD